MTSTVHSQSAHPASERLEDQAASTALRSARDSSKASSTPLLDEDGRLSSAGAAASLKYARAQDLPSFPSQGGVSLSKANAAANLANDNQKPFEHWKPQAIPAANKAAMQAKDYEMDPLWQPELSKAGSKAAIIAHRDTKSPPAIYTPTINDRGTSGNTSTISSSSPVPHSGRDSQPSDGRKALLAATKSMNGSRRRADSAPIKPAQSPPTSNPNANSNWALKAATHSHRAQNPSQEFTYGDPGFEAARIQNTAKGNVSRQMYGSAPPVSIEVQEKNRQDMLRASAIAMAQKMYAIQQQHIEDAKGAPKTDSKTGARAARNRTLSDTSSSRGTGENPARFENLEEAARRLAQERLAKIHDEHAEYRQYYGADVTPGKPSRLSNLRSRRRRANSEPDPEDSDEEEARKIRSQMSLFQGKLAEVDSKKRQADRDALLEAAHRNVTKQMNLMDEKVFEKTGKASPQQRELWERQARERAQRESDDRMMNVGRVHIGGGKYLDQSEIDAIARARLQPTLDEITDKAEKQRAADEEARVEKERLQREADRENQRKHEIKKEQQDAAAKEKAEDREHRNELKRVRTEEANAAKAQRREEKAAEKERLRQEKEEKRTSKEDKSGGFATFFRRSGGAVAGATVGAAAATTGAVAATGDKLRPGTSGTDDAEPTEGSIYDNEEGEQAAVAEAEEAGVVDERPGTPKRDSKTKTWFKSRFRSSDSTDVPETAVATEEPATPEVAREDDVEPPSPAVAEDVRPSTPKRRSSLKKVFKNRFRSSSKEDLPTTLSASEEPGTSATVHDAVTTEPETAAAPEVVKDEADDGEFLPTVSEDAKPLARTDSRAKRLFKGRFRSSSSVNLVQGGGSAETPASPTTAQEEVKDEPSAEGSTDETRPAAPRKRDSMKRLFKKRSSDNVPKSEGETGEDAGEAGEAEEEGEEAAVTAAGVSEEARPATPRRRDSVKRLFKKRSSSDIPRTDVATEEPPVSDEKGEDGIISPPAAEDARPATPRRRDSVKKFFKKRETNPSEAVAAPEAETQEPISPEPLKEGEVLPTSDDTKAKGITRKNSRTSRLLKRNFRGSSATDLTKQTPEAQATAEGQVDEKAAGDEIKPTSGRKRTWLKGRFRSSSKTEVPTAIPVASAEPSKEAEEEDKARSDSMRDVAMAGRNNENEDMYGDGLAKEPVSPVKDSTPVNRDRSPSISSLSSNEREPKTSTEPKSTEASAEQTRISTDGPPSASESSDVESRGRRGFRSRLLNRVNSLKNKNKNKQGTIAEENVQTNNAPMEKMDTTTTNNDDFEEARDTFEEEKLAPPPKLTDATSGSPRGSRERSRFTEDL